MAPSMARSLLELKLISCKDVKASFNFFKKLSISATVSIINQPSNHKKKATERYQQQNTQVDKEGEGYANWNHQMTFDLREISSVYLETLFLEFDLKCEGMVYGNNSVGHVRVPIKELVLQDCKGTSVQSVCYQVMSCDGKHNGVLDFSYKLIHLDDHKVPENLYQPMPANFYPANPASYMSPENLYQPMPANYPVNLYPANPASYMSLENLYQPMPSVDLLPESRHQPTQSIYPSLESIESNYVSFPEVQERVISRVLPEYIYPSVGTVPVLPEKPHVYFQPPVEVNYYYSPPTPSAPSFVYPPVSNNSYRPGLIGYDHNAVFLPYVHPFQPYYNNNFGGH